MTRLTVLMGYYRCEECQHNFHGVTDLNRHMVSKIHVQPVRRIKKSFNCEYCKYNTPREAYMILHIKTKKHAMNLRKTILNEIRNFSK